jgi:hypothetical protein
MATALAVVFSFVPAIRCQEPSGSRTDFASSHLGQTWVPTVLVPWVSYGADFGGVSGWHLEGISADQNADAWFTKLQLDGVRTIVWFLFGDGRGGLKFNESGDVQGLAPGFLNDYQSVLSLARKHHLQVIWILVDFEMGMPAETYQGVQEFGHPGLFEDASKRKFFIENGLDPILRVSGASEQIAGWIVINEPEHLLRSGYVSEPAMRSFVQETTAVIKQFHPGARVAIANSDLAAMLQFSDLDSLDFLVLHYYQPDLPPPATWQQQYLLGRPGATKIKRPIFIGEFALGSPPGGDLGRFVQVCRAFGYAGAWPWSLRTNSHESDGQATDPNEQLEQVGVYARSVLSLQKAPVHHGSADIKKMRESVVAELRSELPSVEQRVASLQGEPARQQAEVESNKEWEARAQSEIQAARTALKTQGEQEQEAQSDIEQNEAWASRATPGDLDAAQAALGKSQDWLQEIQSQIRSAEEEIPKQQQDVATAEERIRMHSYLAREAATELSWLEIFRARLANERSLKLATAAMP